MDNRIKMLEIHLKEIDRLTLCCTPYKMDNKYVELLDTYEEIKAMIEAEKFAING